MLCEFREGIDSCFGKAVSGLAASSLLATTALTLGGCAQHKDDGGQKFKGKVAKTYEKSKYLGGDFFTGIPGACLQ